MYEGQTRFDVIYGTVAVGNTSATAGVQKNDTAFDQYFCDGSGGAATGGQSYILQAAEPRRQRRRLAQVLRPRQRLQQLQHRLERPQLQPLLLPRLRLDRRLRRGSADAKASSDSAASTVRFVALKSDWLGTREEPREFPNRGAIRLPHLQATVLTGKCRRCHRSDDGAIVLYATSPASQRVQGALSYLTNPAVAFPLNVGYLAGCNVGFERAEATDAGFPSLQ